MAVSSSTIIDLLLKEFELKDISLKDTVGDSNHYELTVKSEKFRGLSLLNQQRLVKKTLGNIVGNELHAISIKTIVL